MKTWRREREIAQEAREELGWLLARHDSGALAPGVWERVKALQTDVAWLQHHRREFYR
jgi:hypothetical protein